MIKYITTNMLSCTKLLESMVYTTLVILFPIRNNKHLNLNVITRNSSLKKVIL